MSGLAALQARIDALRWAADYMDAHHVAPTPDNLRGLADVLAEAHSLVAPDYAETQEPEPEQEQEEPDAPAASSLPHAGEGQGEGDDEGEPDDTPVPPDLAAAKAAAAAAVSDTPRRPPGRGTAWTEEELATLRRMRQAGHSTAEIAAALGCTPQRVNDKAKTIPELRQRAPRKPRAVPLPNPAEHQAAEDAALAEVADADLDTIREWLRTHAKVDPTNQPDASVLTVANAARAAHNLPPFRLTRRAGAAA